MHRTFRSANTDEFQDIASSYPFTRRITEVHLHHTWKPRQSDYRGLATIEGMWRHHTDVNGWDDIAQHVTIAPDGAIWLCRNFNWAPASARGFNGNRHVGPFMIEMIGDFDTESIADAQIESTLTVIKVIQRRFGLDAHAIRFHNEMSDKSCPGRGVDKRSWIERIESHELRERHPRGDARLFPRQSSRYWELVREMNPDAEQRDDMFDAEHDVGVGERDSGTGGRPTLHEGGRTTAGAPRGLDDERLDELADHVVNLERGRFSTSGRIDTTAADVDRVFEERLPEVIDRARTAGRRARLLFYAHGGLVSEKNALLGAARQLDFWRANDVYPMFFVWETGFAETVRQLVAEAAKRGGGGARGGPFDWLAENVTDRLIEELARALGGGKVWAGMQSSAALASAEGGGAAHVAKRLHKLWRNHRDELAVHTAGHSAGCIFNAHFMSELARREVPIETAHYLAPAIRNDLFHDVVTPLLGDGVAHLTVYTMTKRREKDDTVTAAYRKSLLYLVHEAFERERGTPILGLEESLRGDRRARDLFGLRGTPSTRAEVIWSPSADSGSGSSSSSLTHGGFDDDPVTMQSVARRVLGRRDGEPIAPFPTASSRDIDDFWNGQFEWPPGLGYLAPGAVSTTGTTSVPWPGSPITPGGAGGKAGTGQGVSQRIDQEADESGSDGGPDEMRPGGGSDERPAGRRQALCIGIDAYRRSPLSGCVSDARTWKRTLEQVGFDVELLVDEEATAARILSRVEALVLSGQPGDHLVLQFAGHGTRFEDVSGDEADGDTPAHDECLCAFDADFDTGGLVIDDELRLLIDGLREGVSMTCFFDCCHSGSASRMAARRAARSRGPRDVRTRFLAPSKAMERAYERSVKRIVRTRSGEPTVQRDVLFSACRSSELAYESDGQGEFTRHATRLIDERAMGPDNRGFHEQVLKAFGDAPRQTPEIHCAVSARARPFLDLDTRGAKSAGGGEGNAVPHRSRSTEQV